MGIEIGKRVEIALKFYFGKAIGEQAAYNYNVLTWQDWARYPVLGSVSHPARMLEGCLGLPRS